MPLHADDAAMPYDVAAAMPCHDAVADATMLLILRADTEFTRAMIADAFRAA